MFQDISILSSISKPDQRNIAKTMYAYKYVSSILPRSKYTAFIQNILHKPDADKDKFTMDTMNVKFPKLPLKSKC